MIPLYKNVIRTTSYRNTIRANDRLYTGQRCVHSITLYTMQIGSVETVFTYAHCFKLLYRYYTNDVITLDFITLNYNAVATD